MAFSDTFDGTLNETLGSRSGWTLIGGDADHFRISPVGSLSGEVRVGVKTAVACAEIGADQEVWGRGFTFSASAARNNYMCVRIQSTDAWVGMQMYGNGGAGLRLTKSEGGTLTDLITAQGASGEWYRVVAQGDQFSLWKGGTGETPSWVQVGTTQTVATVTGTRSGVAASAGSTAVMLTEFHAQSLGASERQRSRLILTPW